MTKSDGAEMGPRDGSAEPEAEAGTRHAVLVGINEYQDTQVRDLQFARADAQAMYDLLTDPQRGGYKPNDVTLLLDKEATKAGILKTLRYKLRPAVEPEDSVIFYFAGHGTPAPAIGGEPSPDGLEKFFVPYDGELATIGLSGLSMEDMRKSLEALKARQVVCLLDCCFSGAGGGRTIPNPHFQTRASLTDEFLEDLSGDDRVVMTACGVNEVSIESSEEGHGIFTRFVIEGLGGAADVDGNGVVGVPELYQYVHREVSRHARKLDAKMTPLLKGSARGEVPLIDYQGPALRKAKDLHARATDAAETGDFGSSEELWNEVLGLFPAFPGALAGLEGLAGQRRQLRKERARMRHIFISYARPDQEQAGKLAAILESEGWPVWWDSDLRGGETWRKEITEALDAAGCVIVLWSHVAIDRPFVLDEASRAQRRNVLLPIRITDVEPPIGFGQAQTEDLLDWDGAGDHPAIRRMVEAIDPILARSGPLPEEEWENAIPVDAPLSPESIPAPAPSQAPALMPDQALPTPLQEAEALPISEKEPWVGPDWLRRLAVRARPMLTSKIGIVALLTVFFLINWGETTLENVLPELPWEDEFTIAFHWFEGRFDFIFHDLTNMTAAVGYTVSYFGLFPLLLLYPAILLTRRNDVDGFRVYSLAIILDYVFTLPFYILLPVNERWFYPDSSAMMLSDKINTALIDFIRPMSGLDNCFPSTHTSLTVVAILMCFVLKLPLRFSVLALGSTVVLSTLVLGVHWAADVVAGVAMGAIAVAAALRLDDYVRRVWASSEPDLQT